MKRVYTEVSVAGDNGDWHILLDRRRLQTPARCPYRLPRRALAEAVAAEWAGQRERIVPSTMPLTALSATALDRIASQLERVVDETSAFGGTDLICYRASAPADLVARQQAIWQPLVDWATLRYDAPLVVTTGVVPRRQSGAALAALRTAVAGLDAFRLSALQSLCAVAGSLVIGLAVLEQRIDAETAWQASQCDELYQAEKWGRDAEAEARRRDIRRDIEAAAEFLHLLRS